MSAAMSLVVVVWVVFCVVVSPVLGASIPVVSKLVLRGPAVEPPKMHIHHLASTRNNSVVNNPCSCGVVGLDGALGLRPSHINEGLAVWNHLACSDKEGSKFQFGSKCHNKFDDLGNGEDRAVEAWVRDILREKDMSSSSAPRLLFIKEASIRVST
jgi:hypothetical protein